MRSYRKSLTLALSLFVICGSGFAQTHDYTLALDPAGERIEYSASSLLGNISGDDHFIFKGHIGVQVTTTTAPFGQCIIKGVGGSEIYADPNEQYNYLANPIPGQPPLMETWLRDFEIYMLSDPFVPDALSGDFSTDATLTITRGTMEVNLFGFTTWWHLGGSGGTNPFPVGGNITQYGGKIELISPMLVPWSGDISGFPVVLTTQGTITAECQIAGINPQLTISNLSAGQSANFDFTGGLSNDSVWLAASVAGLGVTEVPPLHLTAGILLPMPVGTGLADSNGAKSWTLSVPNQPGLNVWFQVVQMGLVSNVEAKVIL